MVREEALDQLESAEVDLTDAKEVSRRGSYHLAVFLAHQAVEKALKAAIIAVKRRRPPTKPRPNRASWRAGLELGKEVGERPTKPITILHNS